MFASGAEGATAPETLRQTDRENLETLESAPSPEDCAPKEQGRQERNSRSGLPVSVPVALHSRSLSVSSFRLAWGLSESLRPKGQRGRNVQRGWMHRRAEPSAMAQDVSPLKSTPLTAAHRALGAAMGPFAGYDMPIHYADGVLKEALWTRHSCGLFDVSHMGTALVMVGKASGDDQADHRAVSTMIEPLICGDIAALKPGKLRYSLLLNDGGGIDDDLIVGRVPNSPGVLYVVVNAGNKDADFARIGEAVAAKGGQIQPFQDWALLALQGPKAVQVLSGIVPGVEHLGFMETGRFTTDEGILIISRCGYTGEDGFEILAWPTLAKPLWDRLLANDSVKPIGLGARDALRLEAGLPLHGHDIDRDISPAEADLAFALSPRRRKAGDFPGAAVILHQLDQGPPRIRVGLRVDGAPAREGAVILGPDGSNIGVVSSGAYSPTLRRPIAMGLVPPHFAEPETQLGVIVRERVQTAIVTTLPFVPHTYVRKPVA